MTGRVLQDEIRADYIIAENSWVPLFLDQARTQKAFERHELNDRNCCDTRDKYKKDIKTRGFIVGGRNEMVVMRRSSSTDNSFWILSGAHVIEAIYDAFDDMVKSKRHNPQVAATVMKGIPITEADHRTPIDVVTHLTDVGNILNGIGTKTTFVQAMKVAAEASGQAAPEVDPGAEQAEEEKGDGPSRASQEGLETEFGQFIEQKYPGRWTSFASFKKCRALRNKLSNALFTKFEKYMNQHCIFSDNRIDNVAVYGVLHEVSAILTKVGMLSYFVEVAAFCVPTNDGTPWVIQVPKDAEKLKVLTRDMVQSKVFQASLASQNPGVLTQEGRKPQQGGKKKRKRAETDLIADHVAQGKPVPFLRDVVNTLEHTLDGVPPESIDFNITFWLLLKAIEFGLVGLKQGVKLPVKPSAKVDGKAVIHQFIQQEQRRLDKEGADEPEQPEDGGEAEGGQTGTEPEEPEEIKVKEFKAYHRLRPHLKMLAAVAHGLDANGAEDGDDAQEGGGEPEAEAAEASAGSGERNNKAQKTEAANSTLQDDIKRAAKRLGVDPACMQNIWEIFQSGGDDVKRALTTTITNNPPCNLGGPSRVARLVKRTHKAFGDANTSIYRKLSGVGKMSLEELLDLVDLETAEKNVLGMIADAAWNAIDETCFKVARNLYTFYDNVNCSASDLRAMATICEAFDMVADIFSNKRSVETFLKYRFVYCMALCEETSQAIHDIGDLRVGAEGESESDLKAKRDKRKALRAYLDHTASFMAASLEELASMELADIGKQSWVSRVQNAVKSAAGTTVPVETNFEKFKRTKLSQFKAMTLPALKSECEKMEVDYEDGWKKDAIVEKLVDKAIEDKQSADLAANDAFFESVRGILGSLPQDGPVDDQAEAEDSLESAKEESQAAKDDAAFHLVVKDDPAVRAYLRTIGKAQACASCATAWLMASFTPPTASVKHRFNNKGKAVPGRLYHDFRDVDWGLALPGKIVPVPVGTPLQVGKQIKCGCVKVCPDKADLKTVVTFDLYLVPEAHHLDVMSDSYSPAWTVRSLPLGPRTEGGGPTAKLSKEKTMVFDWTWKEEKEEEQMGEADAESVKTVEPHAGGKKQMVVMVEGCCVEVSTHVIKPIPQEFDTAWQVHGWGESDFLEVVREPTESERAHMQRVAAAKAARQTRSQAQKEEAALQKMGAHIMR
ncbi:unnamed protein product [Prorocentrum cordatum]|uniref:Uncharacterized protein n=1 Tax=Prorocentrum cordatum TaxID=2364126 RepID=A0ABN9VFX3_9DINO|nr:unnamed protein product [Polarella glacialis]